MDVPAEPPPTQGAPPSPADHEALDRPPGPPVGPLVAVEAGDPLSNGEGLTPLTGPGPTGATTRPRLGSAYWRLWSASAISNLGDGVSGAALPLLAASLTRSPARVSVLTTAASLPWLIFPLVSGALVDRWDRRRTMWRVDLVRAGLMAAIAALVLTDTAAIWSLAVLAFLLGTAETLFDNAAQSIVPAVVHRDLLETANGRQYAAEIVTNTFVGPPIGSLLFVAAAAMPFVVDAGSFALAALLIFTLRGSFRPQPPTASSPQQEGTDEAAGPARRSLRRDIGEGVHWLAHHRLLRTLALLLGVMNLCFFMAAGVQVLFAQEILGLSDRAYGLLLAGAAVGSVIGGLVGSRIARALGPARALILAVFASGAGQLVAGLVSSAWLFALIISLSGLMAIVWNVITVSLRQRIIPDVLLGRVNSVYRLLGWGGMPLGALIGGLLADWFGLRVPYVVGGIVMLVSLAAAIPLISQRAMDEAEAAAPPRAAPTAS